MTKCPICSKNDKASRLSKLHFSPVWGVFSFTDKHSSEDPSTATCHSSHSSLISVTFEVSQLKTHNNLLFLSKPFQTKVSTQILIHLTNVDLREMWAKPLELVKGDLSSDKKIKEALELRCCSWRLTDCRVMTHSGQQRVVKIYSERSTLSQLQLDTI